MTVYERALEMIQENTIVGLGSGRASTKFIELLGDKVKNGFKVQGVPTSQASDDLAVKLGIPLLTLKEAIEDPRGIDITVDGADEVDPNLDLIKGYGRALIREKVVAASSKRLAILVGDAKDGNDVKSVPKLGTKGKLPVEVVTFALPLCEVKLKRLGLNPVLWTKDGEPALTDNGNYILDCGMQPVDDAWGLEAEIQAIPGVVGTGLFLGMADVVLAGDENFNLVEERKRN